MSNAETTDPRDAGWPEWLRQILTQSAYPHPVGSIEVLETHLSWIILTGPHAYKLKKPVCLPFVDFSTLELRRACCIDELRLNRRTAPEIYEDVVPLCRSAGGLRFGGTGDVVEYAVRMRQFPQSAVLLAQTRAGLLTGELIDRLSQSVARMHAEAAPAPTESTFGSPETIDCYSRDNITELAAATLADPDRRILERLDAWISHESQRLRSHFEERRRDGFVRECHGDLHLGNIINLDGRPCPFDCLEFNPELRFIDVINDLAFLVMDLEDHGQRRLAWRLLNRWLDMTGDFAGLAALRYYEVDRALVRAKVAAIRMKQPGVGERSREQGHRELSGYLALAARLAEERHPALVLMHGLSGSGKSVIAGQIAEEFGALWLRSDLERKRGVGGGSEASQGPELYSADARSRTYGRLHELSAGLLKQGFTVVVDATFLRRADRDAGREVAAAGGWPFAIVACEAPLDVLHQRIRSRQAAGDNPSDATVDVMTAQQDDLEPLESAELPDVVRCDTLGEFPAAIAVSRLRQRLASRNAARD